MGLVWMTKYGARSVRYEPPTLEEALFAAEGLTEDFEEQLTIAAGLMDWTRERTRAEGVRIRDRRKATRETFVENSRTGRTILVERKSPRRFARGGAKLPLKQRHQG